MPRMLMEQVVEEDVNEAATQVLTRGLVRKVVTPNGIRYEITDAGWQFVREYEEITAELGGGASKMVADSIGAPTMGSGFAQHVRDNYHARPGFVTYNLVRFVKLFHDSGLSLKDVVIMTPFNSVGFQMSPSRRSCEAYLSSLQEGDVIAMSIMAGGFLKLDQAVDYVRTLPRLSGIAVGASSREHAQETFSKLSAVGWVSDQ